MTIQNAEVVSVNAAGGLYTVKNDDYGVMVINGGVFTNGVAGAGAVLNWNDLTINGGTFTGASAVRTLKSGSSNFEIGKSQIKNGTFNGGIDTLDNYNTGITIAVSGGTFSTDVKEYLAEGKILQKNGDTYTAVTNSGITSGTYTAKPTVPDGYKVVENTDGTFTVEKVGGYYYYQPTTDTKTTDTKGSPKTFDAGVGIYAVTAVLSVTGMAWAAKKRGN